MGPTFPPPSRPPSHPAPTDHDTSRGHSSHANPRAPRARAMHAIQPTPPDPPVPGPVGALPHRTADFQPTPAHDRRPGGRVSTFPSSPREGPPFLATTSALVFTFPRCLPAPRFKSEPLAGMRLHLFSAAVSNLTRRRLAATAQEAYSRHAGPPCAKPWNGYAFAVSRRIVRSRQR